MCFLFAHVIDTPNRRIFLVDYVVQLDSTCYLKRTPTAVVLDHRAKNAVYSRFVESSHTGLINAHSHPFAASTVAFSATDDEDDLREMAYQYEQLPRGKRSSQNPSKIHALSMVFGQQSLDARGYKPGTPPALPKIEQVQVLGESLRVIPPSSIASTRCLSMSALSTHIRQIMVFGLEGQKALYSLRVGLVGCGGIGSIMAEGLMRLGVMNLTLVDGDFLATSNLNRWQGGRPKDVGRLKAHVLARRLRSMNPQTKVCSIGFPLNHPKALRAIKGVDVLIGAVDNHQARFLMNRISAQYLIPYLDAATVIKKGKPENNNQMQLLFRLAVVVPGTTACLQCSRFTYWDKKEIALSLYDPQTRALLKASGYIQDHPEIEAPSVYPLNMLATGALLIELKNLVNHFHPLARNVAMDWLHPNRTTVRSDSDNFPEGPAEDCLNCQALLATGDNEPLPAFYSMPPKATQIANDFPFAANE